MVKKKKFVLIELNWQKFCCQNFREDYRQNQRFTTVPFRPLPAATAATAATAVTAVTISSFLTVNESLTMGERLKAMQLSAR